MSAFTRLPQTLRSCIKSFGTLGKLLKIPALCLPNNYKGPHASLTGSLVPPSNERYFSMHMSAICPCSMSLFLVEPRLAIAGTPLRPTFPKEESEQ